MRCPRMVVGLLWCVLWLCLPVLAQFVAPAERMNASQALLQNADPALRVKAVHMLQGESDKRIPEQLILLLRDPAASVRVAAALAIGRLLDASLDDAPMWATRHGREQSRTQRGLNPAILTELGTALQDPDEGVRVAAAIAFNFIDDPRAPALLPVAISYPDIEIRTRALQAITLELIAQTPTLFDLLTVRLQDEPDQNCRTRIGMILGYSRDPRLFDVFRDLLASPDASNRIIALNGFHSIGDQRCGQLALEQLRDPELGVRAAALDVISGYRPPGAVDALLAMLPEARELRGAVIFTLGRLHARQAMPALLALLATPAAQEVHPAILSALRTIGTREAIDAIFALYAGDGGDPF